MPTEEGVDEFALMPSSKRGNPSLSSFVFFRAAQPGKLVSRNWMAAVVL